MNTQASRISIPAFSKKIQNYSHRRPLTQEEIHGYEADIVESTKTLLKAEQDKKNAVVPFDVKIKEHKGIINESVTKLHLGFVDETIDTVFEVKDFEKHAVFIVDEEGSVLSERPMTATEYQLEMQVSE